MTAVGGGDLGHLFGFFGGHAGRLFHKHVLATLERRHRQWEHGFGRRDDVHGVHIDGGEHSIEICETFGNVEFVGDLIYLGLVKVTGGD